MRRGVSCPFCGRAVLLTADGKVPRHLLKGTKDHCLPPYLPEYAVKSDEQRKEEERLRNRTEALTTELKNLRARVAYWEAKAKVPRDSKWETKLATEEAIIIRHGKTTNYLLVPDIQY